MPLLALSGHHLVRCTCPLSGVKRTSVPREITDYDAAGWRPSGGEVDRYGREVDEEYGTKDFERVVGSPCSHRSDLSPSDRFFEEQ